MCLLFATGTLGSAGKRVSRVIERYYLYSLTVTFRAHITPTPFHITEASGFTQENLHLFEEKYIQMIMEMFLLNKPRML